LGESLPLEYDSIQYTHSIEYRRTQGDYYTEGTFYFLPSLITILGITAALIYQSFIYLSLYRFIINAIDNTARSLSSSTPPSTCLAVASRIHIYTCLAVTSPMHIYRVCTYHICYMTKMKGYPLSCKPHIFFTSREGPSRKKGNNELFSCVCVMDFIMTW